MGEQLSFPPNALRDYLSELSRSSTFELDEQDAWNKLKAIIPGDERRETVPIASEKSLQRRFVC